jgi:peptidoglycan/LPS O-acetylase OafA/YrhL
MVALAWWPYATGALSQGDAWQPLTLTCAAAGCALVVAASLRLRGLGMLAAPVQAVARRGYSVYLVHWMVLTVFSNLIDNGVMGMTAAILAFLLATAAVSWATHRWIEVPGMALANLRIRRKPAAAIA